MKSQPGSVPEARRRQSGKGFPDSAAPGPLAWTVTDTGLHPALQVQPVLTGLHPALHCHPAWPCSPLKCRVLTGHRAVGYEGQRQAKLCPLKTQRNQRLTTDGLCSLYPPDSGHVGVGRALSVHREPAAGTDSGIKMTRGGGENATRAWPAWLSG